MNERLLENWLNKANERSFQIPFSHSLASEGYRVVHISRHCGMELGKDILAIAPDDVPCAYQLKGGNLTLKRWKDEISGQMVDLALGQIVHPSINSGKAHRAYLVINGNIEEEASRAITDFNVARIREGRPNQIINTIVRGELFEKFKVLQGNFWPNELVDVKTFLELYLESGTGRLPKEKLARLFESALPFNKGDGQNPSKNECSRAIASSALLCSSASFSFSSVENHVAEFEAWVIYFSYVLALAEKWNLPKENWQPEIEIVLKTIYNSLSRLCDELMKRDHFVEGNPHTDYKVFRVRLTYLLGLMGTYALWRKFSNESENEQDEFLREFCLNNRAKLFLWGEHAVPQFLGFYFYYRTVEVGLRSDFLLHHLMTSIAEANGPRGQQALASPYYDADEILPYTMGLESEPLEDSFRGSSYSLEAIVHLFVRTNLKQAMKRSWHEITKVNSAVFEPKDKWEYYLWESKRGINREVIIPPTQKWENLKDVAFESKGDAIPELIKKYPVPYLSFLCVFPHRMNSSGIRWLDTELKKIL